MALQCARFSSEPDIVRASTNSPPLRRGSHGDGVHVLQLALIDLGLHDGSGVDVVTKLRDVQPEAQSVVVTIHDDDEHLFPALQAGAFGYILKEQPRELITEQLQRISQGEPPLSPSIARRVSPRQASPVALARSRAKRVAGTKSS